MRARFLTAVLAILFLAPKMCASESLVDAASLQNQPSNGGANMSSPIRRVVTGKDSSGKAVAVIDGPAPNVVISKERGTTSTLLWVTDSTPADLSGNADAANRKIGVAPPVNGTVFRVVEFGPEKDLTSTYEERMKVMSELGIHEEGPGSDGPRHTKALFFGSPRAKPLN